MGIILELANIDYEELTRIVITRAEKENRPQGEVLKEEIKKIALNSCDQTESKEHEKQFSSIIAPGENIDNGSIYSEATGETLRDLI